MVTFPLKKKEIFRVGFGLGNLPNNPSIYQPTTPLTALDRFLWGRSHFSQQQSQRNVKTNETPVSTNGLYDFTPSTGAIAGVPLPRFQEINFVDALFFDGDNLNCIYERNLNAGLDEEVKVSARISKGQAKKSKTGSCVTLIKGQWTEEEDR